MPSVSFIRWSGYNIYIKSTREDAVKNKTKLGLCVVVIALILSILSCSSPADLFATATPLPSNTPTDTLIPTSTATPIPTATPVPPVSLYGCAYLECPPSNTISDYIGDAQIQPNVTTTITIPYTDFVHLFYGWCAKTKTALDANMPNVQFFFNIDNVSYLGSLKGEYYEVPDPQIHPSRNPAMEWVV